MALLQGNGDLRLSLWFCCEEGDGAMLSASSMVADFYLFFVVAYGLVH
jgi:hypothetical protein